MRSGRCRSGPRANRSGRPPGWPPLASCATLAPRDAFSHRPELRAPSRPARLRALHVLPQGGVPGVRHDLGRREPRPPVPREEKRRTQVQQIGRRLAPLGCQLRAPLSRGGAGPRLVHRVARETAVTPRSGGALSLVDDATDAVSRMGPWVGLLWITALPARLLLALLCVRLIELGSESPGYGHYLSRLSYAALGAWLVSLWGRQAF